jgi:hypothetical protein
MVGFCKLDVNPPGPTHVYEVAAVLDNKIVWPAQYGPLLVATTVGLATTVTDKVLVFVQAPFAPVTE